MFRVPSRARGLFSTLLFSPFFASLKLLTVDDDLVRWCNAIFKLVEYKEGPKHDSIEEGVPHHGGCIESFAHASAMLCAKLAVSEQSRNSAVGPSDPRPRPETKQLVPRDGTITD
jgi:hypothetical protein